MSEQLKNKIEANDTSINKLLKEQKFYIDYFQREYRWEEKHMKQLVEDLTSTFLRSFSKEHGRAEVANYRNYYLGPSVFSVDPDTNKKSIIDGQQRITSLTLFLIFLNHKQESVSSKVSISELIFSEKFGEKSFNMSDEYRDECLKALFEEGAYTLKEDDNETVVNMVNRYADIEIIFPEEIDDHALPYFIDWLIQNVVIVEIIAYSDENAYIIFETMNDRGMNLTATEMLKGFVLSKISDRTKRDEINSIWKKLMQELHEYADNADQTFFQAWFRGKYAVSIRPGKAGSENKDYELIGSEFHRWFKDKHEPLFKLNNSEDFYHFFKNEFPFFVKAYMRAFDAWYDLDEKIPHAYYTRYWGIADSLEDPMLLAPINYGDTPSIVDAKFDFVCRYIETFTVRS